MNIKVWARLGRAKAARFSPDAGERGIALLAAVFFMVFAAGLSVVLLSTILSQSAPAISAAKNTRTVYSAQAGLQSALGLIRSAAGAPDATGHIFGSTSKLPCRDMGNELIGLVNGTTSGAGYAVTIDYYKTDPTNETDAWRASPLNKIACSALVASTPTVPSYAYVYAGGKDASVPADPDSGDRSLAAVYKFKVSNVNIPGGRIWNVNRSYCLQADNDKNNPNVDFVPASGCVDTNPKTYLQLWTYSPDYQLILSSTTAVGKTPICITGPKRAGDTNEQQATADDCLANTNPGRWRQLWNWTGDYSWRGQSESISGGPSNYCLSPDIADGSAFPSNPSLYVRQGCNGTFAPSSLVGSGAAGYDTHQLVNYAEFGRCADVTNENINSSFMISYPCKQDPTGTGTYLKWNHKWYYTEPSASSNGKAAPQPIYVKYLDNESDKRCLTAPSASSATGDVTFQACNVLAPAPNQLWTRWNDTKNNSSSYLMMDNLGRCLFTDPSDPFNTYYSKVRVKACDGSLTQKWNAPPVFEDSTFGSYREIAH